MAARARDGPGPRSWRTMNPALGATLRAPERRPERRKETRAWLATSWPGHGGRQRAGRGRPKPPTTRFGSS
eukprot:8539655-Alexandrium_andersonii.AAC.1